MSRIGRPRGSADRPGTGRSTGAPAGNTNRETTGHRGAEVALSKGQRFRGLALVKEREVEAEYETEGVDALLLRDAIRLQTVCDLYYDAILCASQKGRIATLERYLARHASLTARAMAAWQQIRNLKQADIMDGVLADALDAAREATNGD